MALWQSEKFTTENLFGFLWNSDNELGDYYLPLETNILPKIGSIVPTFTRDTIGTVVDFEGVVHDCQIDEARFQGARRVENLITNSENMTADDWTIEQTATITPTTFTALEQSAASKQNINTEEGVSYILSFTAYVAEGARGTGFYFRHFNSPTGARTEIPLITSTPTRYEVEILGRIGGGSCLIGIYDSNSSDWVTLNITDFQFEKVSGSQTEASEYVSDGVLENPYHGAGVDGVKYFNTDRNGNLLTDIKGYLNEPESTNLLTYSEEFDDASWVNNNCIVSSNDIVAPNGTKTADKIEINTSGAVSRLYKSINWSAGDLTASIWLKAGNVTTASLRCFSSTGSQNSNLTLTDEWQKFDLGLDTTSTNGSFQIYPHLDNVLGSGLSGDYIYAWGAQLEENAFATSYIKTTGDAVTRTTDSLVINNLNRDVLPNSFCLVGTWTPLGDGGDYETTDVRLFGTQDSRGAANEIVVVGGAAYAYTLNSNGGVFQIAKTDLNQGVENKFAFSLFQDGSNVNAKIYKDGVEKLSEVETQTLDHSNESLEIGSWTGTVFASMIKDIKIYAKKLTPSQLKRITT